MFRVFGLAVTLACLFYVSISYATQVDCSRSYITYYGVVISCSTQCVFRQQGDVTIIEDCCGGDARIEFELTTQDIMIC